MKVWEQNPVKTCLVSRHEGLDVMEIVFKENVTLSHLESHCSIRQVFIITLVFKISEMKIIILFKFNIKTYNS